MWGELITITPILVTVLVGKLPLCVLVHIVEHGGVYCYTTYTQHWSF